MNLRKGYDNASLANKRNTQKFSKLIAKRLRKFSVVYCGGDTEKGRKAHLPYDSSLRITLAGVWNDFQCRVFWQIGDGNKTNLWLYLREQIRSPCGIRKDLTASKLLYGWRPMNTFLQIFVEASGVWTFLTNAPDVGEAMKQPSMCFRIVSSYATQVLDFQYHQHDWDWICSCKLEDNFYDHLLISFEVEKQSYFLR
ncbi:hypothetical protein MTR_6g029440 [Medicago truncatula]|uniref:Uncharacterized protein n=1 Tax=Medicago truncatula TaxID=3880 RepID=G7KPN1_MEDTR|nr:hypothetical protein MTR_6g029440 [Medicago truncatula]